MSNMGMRALSQREHVTTYFRPFGMDVDCSAFANMPSYFASESLSDVPSTLWHYTKLPGLKGILGTNTVWASDVTKTNDKKEIKFAMEIIFDVVKSISENDPNPYSLSKFVLGTLTRWAEPLNGRFFITCFTTTDCKQHWTEYGDFAIAFDTKSIRQFSSHLTTVSHHSLPDSTKCWSAFYKVNYDHAVFCHVYADFFSRLQRFVDDNQLDLSNEETRFALHYLISDYCLFHALMMKEKERWEYEQEYRLLIIKDGPDPINFEALEEIREVGGIYRLPLKIPHVCTEYGGKLPIRQIRVSPYTERTMAVLHATMACPNGYVQSLVC